MTTSTPDNHQLIAKPLHPKPDLDFVSSHIIHFISFGGGVGLSQKVPGTVGILVAFPFYWLLEYYFAPVHFLLLITILFILGIWTCHITGRVLGAPNHAGIVWGKIVSFILVLFFIPDNWTWQTAALLLFHLFDYIKSKQQIGYSIMFRDLITAFLVLFCLAGWKAFVLT